ncbi:MAG TPA: Ig-like domain repeat protein, partial [Rhodothermales bacterium]|nr:Ig-like domain repeat protein [Rhodothermales bacterium]
MIDAAHRAAALPIIQAWQTNSGDRPVFQYTVLHEATAPFTAEIGRSLVAAPRIAILEDGNEDIAFAYLRAAGIPDSRGVHWPAAKPAPPEYVDVISPADIAGATTTNHRDGILFDASGLPRFSLLITAHWFISNTTEEQALGAAAIAEIKEFLTWRTLVFAECQSAITLEAKGLFLTDQGLTIKPQVATQDAIHYFADHPLEQVDGVWSTVGGSVPSFSPTGVYLGVEGTEYYRFIRGPSADVFVAGYALQNAAAGRVVYLGGHQYSTAVPISANTTTNGVRNVLNALLFAPATAIGDGSADVIVTLANSSSSTTPEMDFSITYRNQGLGVAHETTIVVPIPAGTSASLISDGGSVSNGEIIWNLGNLGPAQPDPEGTLTFRLTASGTGTFTVTSTANYKRGITPASAASTAIGAYRLATTTGLTSSLNPSGYEHAVTFTATVASSEGTPSGTVTFKDGDAILGTGVLSEASPSFTTSTLATGTHAITAIYEGDNNFEPSTSPVVSQSVGSAFDTPLGLTATATSSTAAHVTWLPVSAADHYEIFSRSNAQPFALRETSATTEFTDGGLSGGTTYVYQVRAVSASSETSGFSNIDPATTILFTDDALVATSTLLKAVHLNELRQAVNAMRVTAGLEAILFSEAIAAGTILRASHMNE